MTEYFQDAVIGVSRQGNFPDEFEVKFYKEGRDVKPPAGYPFGYSLRKSSETKCKLPDAIERGAVMNFAGKIFSKEKILTPYEGYLPVRYLCLE